jgi:hypothetical protein
MNWFKRLLLRTVMPRDWELRRGTWCNGARSIIVFQRSTSTSCVAGIEGEPGRAGLTFDFLDNILSQNG